MGISRRKLGTALVALGAGCLVGMAGSWLDLQLSQRLDLASPQALSESERVPSAHESFGQAVRVDRAWQGAEALTEEAALDADRPAVARPSVKRRLVRSRGWPTLVGEAIDPWDEGAVALASAHVRKRAWRSSLREVSWAYRRDVVDPWAGPATR